MIKALLNEKVYFYGLLSCLLVDFVLSSIPGQVFENLPVSIWDGYVHFVMFLPIGFFLMGWRLCKQQSSKKISFLKTAILCLLVVVGIGMMDELHQFFVPRRSMSFTDVIADTLGGATGIVLNGLLFRKWLFRKIGINPSALQTML